MGVSGPVAFALYRSWSDQGVTVRILELLKASNFVFARRLGRPRPSAILAARATPRAAGSVMARMARGAVLAAAIAAVFFAPVDHPLKAATVSQLHVGAIFSTKQSASQSFLRFYNTGTTAGTVTVTLSD